MAPDVNRIETPLRQEAFELSPESQRELRLSDEIAWSWSVLFGRAGSLQVPLECSDAGVLAVSDVMTQVKLNGIDTELSALRVDLKYEVGDKLISTNDTYNLADYFDSTQAAAPFYESGQGLAYMMNEIFAILTDVWDYTNHYLKVHETA